MVVPTKIALVKHEGCAGCNEKCNFNNSVIRGDKGKDRSKFLKLFGCNNGG